MDSTQRLNGRTVLRFAHAFESGGGTERYLDDLDRALLERNAMTVVRLHLTRRPVPAAPIEQKIGRGTLICVPLAVTAGDRGSSRRELQESSLCFRLKQKFRDWVLYNPAVWGIIGATWTRRLTLPRQPGQAIGAGRAAAQQLQSRRIDLAILHYFGGADADEVLAAARAAGVPVGILNHYSNDRFLHLAIRKHAMAATGIAGVNGLGLPRYVRQGFANLSDGVDTDFFRRALAATLPHPPRYPIILLPARVVREKGQLDLVRAVSHLRKSGVECGIAFAGRVDSSEFVTELKGEIAGAGMEDCVRFLGDLTVAELRDWYAACTIMAFPTYHHEGLGRVIVEAQAMETPVIAYATGGVAEAIEHGKTGYLLPTGDLAGLIRYLRELLLSPLRRAELGAAGRKVVEQRFSLAALASRHEQFYAQVISDYRGGPP